jgi:hypothetical protein
MTVRLSPISSGVAHSSAHRTRLKVPKSHNIADHSLIVKDAIEHVPGVRDVKVVPPIGSVIVEHENRADVLENIGDAIAKASPELFALLTAELPGRNLALMSVFSNLFQDDQKSAVDDAQVGLNFKKAIPYAFLAAGLMQVLEGEALLAGVGPLALFYWAFDSRWKFKQEAVAAETHDSQILPQPVLKQVK